MGGGYCLASAHVTYEACLPVCARGSAVPWFGGSLHAVLDSLHVELHVMCLSTGMSLWVALNSLLQPDSGHYRSTSVVWGSPQPHLSCLLSRSQLCKKHGRSLSARWSVSSSYFTDDTIRHKRGSIAIVGVTTRNGFSWMRSNRVTVASISRVFHQSEFAVALFSVFLCFAN